MADREAVDVAIIGAGAAGCQFAAKLAQAGKKVAVFEAGPPWTMGDLISSQIWSRRLKWGNAPVLHEGDAHFPHSMGTGWGFGGAALHHYAGWPRLRPEDFKTASLYGRSLDWPIAYEDLRPFYDQIQTEVGICGDAEAEITRPEGAPYPMPPAPEFAQHRIIKAGFERLGLRTAPTPLAITTVEYNNRPACIWDGWCDAGCPIYALANPLATYFLPAQDAGATFEAYHEVDEIVADDSGHVTGVRVRPREGEPFFQPAAVTILAASVQNARLLLLSRSTRHPDGLANRFDQVGRYFAAHMISNTYGMFEEETELHMGVTAGTLMSVDYHEKDKGDEGFGAFMYGIGPALKPNDLLGIANTRGDLFGAPLHAFMRDAARHLGNMTAIMESITLPENRITLDTRTDAHGRNLAKITHNLAPESRRLWEFANREGQRIMNAAGARESWNSPFGASHALGGTIMGAHPESSVTDSYGRPWDIRGLVVAGGTLFPSVGGGSPTYTLHALGLRTIGHMLAHWGEYTA